MAGAGQGLRSGDPEWTEDWAAVGEEGIPGRSVQVQAERDGGEAPALQAGLEGLRLRSGLPSSQAVQASCRLGRVLLRSV